MGTSTVEIQALKASYQTQLSGVTQNISQLQNQIKMLELQREQLKGAIYALDQVVALDEQDKAVKNDNEQSETKEG